MGMIKGMSLDHLSVGKLQSKSLVKFFLVQLV